MNFTEKTTFHEFLVRGDDATGAIRGAHIQDRIALVDENGAEVPGYSRFSDPRPVGLGDADLLASIGAGINAASLTTVAGLQASLAAAQAAQSAAESERDVAVAQLAALQPVIDGVPQFVKKWQLWAGLRMDDPSLALYNAVRAYTNSFTGAMKDLWDDSTGVERTAPALAGFKAGFGKTDADLDGMFTRYAAITQADVVALG